MITGSEYAAKVEEAYNCKGGYIYAKKGVKWTNELQDKIVKAYKNNPTKYKSYAKSAEYGRKWVGHRVWDCSGLTSWAGDYFGFQYAHGSNSSYNKDCQAKGPLKKGMKLPVGAWVYTGDAYDRGHIGTVTSADGQVTEAKGTIAGVVHSKVTDSKWTWWGLGKGIAFDFIPDHENMDIKPTDGSSEKHKQDTETKIHYPTLRRGSKGELVTQLQDLLSKDGSSLAVDGIFGSGTQSAVRSFQKRHGLVVDGIVGPKTWAELLKLV